MIAEQLHWDIKITLLTAASTPCQQLSRAKPTGAPGMAAALHPDLNNPYNYQEGIISLSTRTQHRRVRFILSLLFQCNKQNSLPCSDAGPAAATKVPPPQVPLFSEPHQPPKEVHGRVINHGRVAVPSSGAAAVTGAGDTQPLPCVWNKNTDLWMDQIYPIWERIYFLEEVTIQLENKSFCSKLTVS